MDECGALLFYHLLFILILAMSLSCESEAIDEERKVYIVYMGALPDDEVYSPLSHHHSMLQSVIDGSSVADCLVQSYERSFNGFAAKLTDRERQKLASNIEVVSIFPSEMIPTQTTRSWDFMGFHETVDRNPTIESDTIIGVIDTGIWPESESFSDEGFGPPPKKWKGACQGGKDFTCNNKIIGARSYPSYKTDYKSARDDVGHGTHAASIAAGNNVKQASFYGLAEGIARGGVPSARIAAYKVCGPEGCSLHSIMAAFDDAIADGVDIISISLGNFLAYIYDTDVIAIGGFHAMQKGILTVSSAGNSGPYVGSVASVAPWLMTVAASSIDRRIIDKVVLGNGETIIGNSVNSFILNGTTFPLIQGRNASSNCSDSLARACNPGCLDSSLVKGKIVLCDTVAGFWGAYTAGAIGSDEAYRAGALGLISTGGLDDVSFVVPLPASNINNASYVAVMSYLNSTIDPRVTILKSEVIKDFAAPKIASFSSRGPNIITLDIMKPDISAPGVEILAAYSPIHSPSSIPDDKRRVKYNIDSGTSIACPHVAGAAAYVKSFHPDWSPSAIKSALMTTALVMNNTKDSHGEFDHGSGHVNPSKAINPGLVYEASVEDYIEFLCSIGYNDERVGRLSRNNSTCPKDSNKLFPKNLNYPSMTVEITAGVSFTVKFHRRVKNVGLANSTYKARIFQSSLTEIKVVPEVLSFKSLNEEKSFEVIVKGGAVSHNSMVSASLMWSDGTHGVTSPIVIYNYRPVKL